MRTTLDIDPRVLAAARSRVHAGQARSVGEAVSELALAGLAPTAQRVNERNGIMLVSTDAGETITDETVEQALLDE